MSKIMLYKRYNGDGDYVDDDPPYTFNNIMLRKAEVSDPLRGDREESGDDKVSAKLRAMVNAMVMADPTKSEEEHLHYLLHNAHGRRLAEHLNSLSKHKDEPMPQVDITKLHNIDSVTEVAKNVNDDKVSITEHEFTEILTGHAKVAGTTLEKILTDPNNGEIRKAYRITKGMVQTAG